MPWKRPFHALTGSHSSTLMNESVVGVITTLTLQNEGRFGYVTPFEAVKLGPGIIAAPVTVPPLRPTFSTVRFSQVPARADPVESRPKIAVAAGAQVRRRMVNDNVMALSGESTPSTLRGWPAGSI